MPSLNDDIDDLYRLPLGEFTAARNALAKSIGGADAKRVRALAKPTLVPWTVNQVYWHARSTYDRLIKNGHRLRKAQIAALEGRAADVREAADAHRQALSEAVGQAARYAALAGSDPGPDALMRTFEAISLATELAEPPGRLTQPLQPMGFEALADVRVKVRLKPDTQRDVRGVRLQPDQAQRDVRGVRLQPDQTQRDVRGVRLQPDHSEPKPDLKHLRAVAEASRRREADVKQAQTVLARAEAAETRARQVWDRAHDELLKARQKLQALRQSSVRST